MNNQQIINQIHRHHIQWMIDWCYQTLGHSKFHPPFKLRVYIQDKQMPDFGYFDRDKNLININVKSHKTLVSICDTVIHEFVHWLQNLKYYHRYEKKYGYDNNPYELEAITVAKQLKFKLKKQFISSWMN